MPTITWSNGKVDTADSWELLLDHVRKTQWHRYDDHKFRLIMRRRALLWSGVKISIDCTAEQFIRELQYAKLVVVNDDSLPVLDDPDHQDTYPDSC